MSNSKSAVVAIVGRANVGKSSFFNVVIGRREVITSKEPGTTRDSISAKASYGGKDFWLVDTAGLKDAVDDFELTIQEQIGEAADAADYIIVVVDAGVPPTEEDRRVAKMALKSKKPVVLAINKVDTNRRNLELWKRLGVKDIFAISVTQKVGIEELLSKVVADLPKATIAEDGEIIRMGLVGRPNVGKSSLFNALAKKQQALVADRAGTTRDVNRTIVRYNNQSIEIADTAGIRRSGKIERGVEHFSVLRALSVIEQSDVILLVMDVGELNVQLDQKIAGLVKEAGKGLLLVVSKWDSADKDSYTHDILAPQIAHNFVFVPWAPLIFTSAYTGQNIAKLFDLVTEVYSARQEKFTTSELNNWLGKITHEHPPAGLKGRTPKLNYMVQETNSGMPSFKVFGAHTKFLHWSYKRYMDRRFRETWPLGGTPLKFWFIEKH